MWAMTMTMATAMAIATIAEHAPLGLGHDYDYTTTGAAASALCMSCPSSAVVLRSDAHVVHPDDIAMSFLISQVPPLLYYTLVPCSIAVSFFSSHMSPRE